MTRRTHAEEIAFRQQVIRDRAAAVQERARRWDAIMRAVDESRVAASLHADDTIYVNQLTRLCGHCGSDYIRVNRIDGINFYRCGDCGHEDA